MSDDSFIEGWWPGKAQQQQQPPRQKMTILFLGVVVLVGALLGWRLHRPAPVAADASTLWDEFGYFPEQYKQFRFVPSPERIQLFAQPQLIHTFAYFTLSRTRDRHGADIFVVSNNRLDCLDKFVADLPQRRRPFKLVLCHGDYGVTALAERVDAVLAHPFAVRVYAVDCDRAHPRLVPIPIGLDYHTLLFKQEIEPGQQDRDIRAISDALPPATKRPVSVYVNSHLNLTDKNPKHAYPNGRAQTHALFRNDPLFTFESRVQPRDQIHKRHGEHLFILSPPGNGLDCHRTWEALALGGLPIVRRTGAMDAVFDDLPVVRVDRWEEITAANLRRWRAQFLPFDPKQLQKLSAQYWLDRIKTD